MAKFELTQLGIFDKLWNSADKRYLQTFIDNSALLKNNYGFWESNFSVDPNIVPTDSNGEMSFTVRTKKNEPDGMAEFKASMARNTGIDQLGSAVYSGSLPNFGKALNPITIMDREAKAKVVAQFGNESPLVLDYIENIQILKNYADSRLSNMAAQMISTGKIIGKNDSTNGHNMYLLDAKVGAENRVTAGEKIWSDPACDLLDQMSIIESNYRLRTGDMQPMKWQIPLYMWRNVFLKNAKLKADIIAYRKLRELPTTSGGTVLEEWVNSFINDVGLTSPIEVVTEGEREVGITYQKDVQGWANTVAVFRPVGYAGVVMHGEILKARLSQQYKSATVDRMVAYLNGGIYALINSIVDVDGYPVQHTDLEGCAAPVLTETPAHIIVDTATADS